MRSVCGGDSPRHHRTTLLFPQSNINFSTASISVKKWTACFNNVMIYKNCNGQHCYLLKIRKPNISGHHEVELVMHNTVGKLAKLACFKSTVDILWYFSANSMSTKTTGGTGAWETSTTSRNTRLQHNRAERAHHSIWARKTLLVGAGRVGWFPGWSKGAARVG